MKRLILMAVVLFTGFFISTGSVSAKGGGHASGGHSSGHSSGGHVSAGRSNVSRGASTGVRGGSSTKGFSSFHSSYSKTTTTKSYRSLSNNSQVLHLNRTYGYSGYARSPYSSYYYHNGSFTNVWFYYWLFNTSWSRNEQDIARQSGITQADAKNLYKNSKHVTIESNGVKEVVIVTPEQYSSIKVGDKVNLKNNNLYVNNHKV